MLLLCKGSRGLLGENGSSIVAVAALPSILSPLPPFLARPFYRNIVSNVLMNALANRKYPSSTRCYAFLRGIGQAVAFHSLTFIRLDP